MSIFNNMFGNNNQIPQNPQSAVLGILENMRSSGKLTDAQYNSLIQNQNNPQEMVQVLLQNGIVSNEQVANARNRASFFGIK